jgi:lambda family phage portal protein
MSKPRRAALHARSKINPKVEEARRAVQAAYYSAASDSPSMDFSFASHIGATEALTADLSILRDRIRYELRQNGPAKGITRVYANATVGTGPTLCIETDPEYKVWADEAEFAWSEWARNCGYVRSESLAELLHVGVRQFFLAGEYFSASKFDSTAKTKSQLRILLVRSDRICQPYSSLENIINGVEFDATGRPAFYYVRKNDNFSFAKESAENIRHVFYQEEPEQVRGEPWLAAGLPDLHKRRRYDEARVAAAIIAAKFAIFITNNDPSIQVMPEDLMPPGVVEINDGAATILPAHCGVQSFSGAQPTTGASDFRREMIANAGAGIGMSANASNQDSSTSNFASARYDDVGFSLEQKIVRDLIANRDLTPMANTWMREASAMKVIDTPPDWFRLVWRWPCAARHTDPKKAADADSARIASGVDSFAQIWSEHGVAKEQRRQEILEELAWFRANKLVHPLDASAQQNPFSQNENRMADEEEEIKVEEVEDEAIKDEEGDE